MLGDHLIGVVPLVVEQQGLPKRLGRLRQDGRIGRDDEQPACPGRDGAAEQVGRHGRRLADADRPFAGHERVFHLGLTARLVEGTPQRVPLAAAVFKAGDVAVQRVEPLGPARRRGSGAAPTGVEMRRVAVVGVDEAGQRQPHRQAVRGLSPGSNAGREHRLLDAEHGRKLGVGARDLRAVGVEARVVTPPPAQPPAASSEMLGARRQARRVVGAHDPGRRPGTVRQEVGDARVDVVSTEPFAASLEQGTLDIGIELAEVVVRRPVQDRVQQRQPPGLRLMEAQHVDGVGPRAADHVLDVLPVRLRLGARPGRCRMGGGFALHGSGPTKSGGTGPRRTRDAPSDRPAGRVGCHSRRCRGKLRRGR